MAEVTTPLKVQILPDGWVETISVVHNTTLWWRQRKQPGSPFSFSTMVIARENDIPGALFRITLNQRPDADLLAGPFETLESAMVVYKMLMSLPQ